MSLESSDLKLWSSKAYSRYLSRDFECRDLEFESFVFIFLLKELEILIAAMFLVSPLGDSSLITSGES